MSKCLVGRRRDDSGPRRVIQIVSDYQARSASDKDTNASVYLNDSVNSAR